jgi:putative ABC transport system substrate-binding protein
MKRNMNNMNKRLFCAFAAAASLSMTVGMPAYAATPSVSVATIVEHPSLDAIRDGLKDGLKELGYEDGSTLKWEFQSAQGNPSTAAQIARKFVGDKSDVIVAITTPVGQAIVAATKTIPVVYSGVTDPVAGQLIKERKATGTNVTGVSNTLDMDTQVALIKQVVPHVKRVGIVYNPGEINSVVVVKNLKAHLAKDNIALVEAAAPRTVDVVNAAKSLVGKVDVIYTGNDNNVVSAYESLVKVGNDAKIPLLAADTDSVKRGAVAAMGIDHYAMGRQTAAMVVRILKGEKPGDIAPENSNVVELFVNTAAAAKQGVTLSPKLLQAAKTIIK